MISLAAPFNSSFINHSSNRINSLRVLASLCLLVLAATPLRAQEAATAEQTPATAAVKRASGGVGTGSITGRVMSEDGRPLADTVVLFNKMYARTPGSPATATTDSEGNFRVSGLEAGLYLVNAMQPGFTVPDALTDTSEPTYYRVGDSVNLTLVKGGVITGTVRDANGEPVIAVPVRTMRVRDSLGRTGAAGRFTGFYPDRMTDDRGIYRIYGLPPGTYVVSAGGSQRFILSNAYENDAPTFFPSSTRDTAAEVPVRAGEEATNIDIRYRGERGHTISGIVSGFVETKMPAGVSITLRQAAGGGFEATTFVMPNVKTSFALNGVSDGVYELAAQQWSAANDNAASIPKRVTIKGADITGIDLVLSPLASISGRVQLEAPPKETCGDARGGTLLETAINARRDQKNQSEDASRIQFFSASGGIPNSQGEFTIPNLITGDYRLSVRLPSEAWYVRSISLPNASPAASAQPAAPAKAAQPKGAATAAAVPSSPVVTLATGARLVNVTVQIAQDAAGLRGRVAPAATEGAESASLPANLKVYLVPAERERAEDVLRYSETQVASDGVFSFQNLAPGRYWLIARSVPENETPERTPRPLAWDAETRAKLRRAAEAANTSLELQPCQRAINYELRYAPPAAKP